MLHAWYTTVREPRVPLTTTMSKRRKEDAVGGGEGEGSAVAPESTAAVYKFGTEWKVAATDSSVGDVFSATSHKATPRVVVQREARGKRKSRGENDKSGKGSGKKRKVTQDDEDKGVVRKSSKSDTARNQVIACLPSSVATLPLTLPRRSLLQSQTCLLLRRSLDSAVHLTAVRFDGLRAFVPTRRTRPHTHTHTRYMHTTRAHTHAHTLSRTWDGVAWESELLDGTPWTDCNIMPAWTHSSCRSVPCLSGICRPRQRRRRSGRCSSSMGRSSRFGFDPSPCRKLMVG